MRGTGLSGPNLHGAFKDPAVLAEIGITADLQQAAGTEVLRIGLLLRQRFEERLLYLSQLFERGACCIEQEAIDTTARVPDHAWAMSMAITALLRGLFQVSSLMPGRLSGRFANGQLASPLGRYFSSLLLIDTFQTNYRDAA